MHQLDENDSSEEIINFIEEEEYISEVENNTNNTPSEKELINDNEISSNDNNIIDINLNDYDSQQKEDSQSSNKEIEA
jgi:hypothetical protein